MRVAARWAAKKQSPRAGPAAYRCGVLDRTRLREFAERGFVLIPQVVPTERVTAAARTIDRLIERRPPGPDVRGPHFYFPRAEKVPALRGLLMETQAWSHAESLTGPGTLEEPWQV